MLQQTYFEKGIELGTSTLTRTSSKGRDIPMPLSGRYSLPRTGCHLKADATSINWDFSGKHLQGKAIYPGRGRRVSKQNGSRVILGTDDDVTLLPLSTNGQEKTSGTLPGAKTEQLNLNFLWQETIMSNKRQ
jgi:hypothetical protein